MNKYNEIMDKIELTGEMRERIIGNIAERQKRRRMKTAITYISAAAACLVIAVGAVKVLNRPKLPQTPPESTPAVTQTSQTTQTSETKQTTQTSETKQTTQTKQTTTSTTSAEPKTTTTDEVPLVGAGAQPPENEPDNQGEQVGTSETEQGERADPEINVTAEEFMENFGAIISVPEGIEILEYRIDTETQRGYMAFYKDEVLWNVYVKPENNYPDTYRIYVDNYMEEIYCELDEGQITKVHGIDSELHYYRSLYEDGSDTYQIFAKWTFEDEGFELWLNSFSETPIHSLPVEIIK